MTAVIEASRLHIADIGRTAAVGLRSRMTHAVLSALGIAIGIASMVAVLGLSDSSKSELLATLRSARHQSAHRPSRGGHRARCR